jgi:hypothetical protein
MEPALMAARKRLPHGVPRELPVRVNAASMAGIARARAVLVTSDPTVVSDLDALAMREQWRREDEARRSAQGCLRLGPTT